ncbi:hypothetical protein M569_03391 [Genlisea aurea]|uniref:AP5B1 middle domain-containing protein n=1 Tax=Genlisea aurea TaxID=192259 RepID=S8CVI4_9LAMI|nr:hypothetical protein M569_03391 [Genlisea aurea]
MAGNLAPPKPLSPSDWEALIDYYYNLGGGAAAGIHRWTGGVSVLELGIPAVLRKDFPPQLKLQILLLLEQYALDDPSQPPLARLVDALLGVIQSPNDPFAFKEQFLISATSIFITTVSGKKLSPAAGGGLPPLSNLVELLLTIINRPNHSVDRHTRGIACECLRQLELAFPCLLSEIAPHLWSLCQSERTHVYQWYVLLLLTAIGNIVRLKPGDSPATSIANAKSPLIPFDLPAYLIDGIGSTLSWKANESSYKELRRVVAFLLDSPQYLTSFGLLEFMAAIVPIAQELQLQASMLRVQFSWLLCTTDPLLCHAFLVLHSEFPESFEGQEFQVASRLLISSKEPQRHLIYRLLGVHWLLGLFRRMVSIDETKKRGIVEMSSGFYPEIYDPLSLKALKLDALAYCSNLLYNSGDASLEVKLFEVGLVSVSAFKWLPPWSSETAVAFRTFHKFMIFRSQHGGVGAAASFDATLIASDMFRTLKNMLVDCTLESPGLVPVVASSIDRLSGCDQHRWLGEHLLETLDTCLLPKLKRDDYRIGHYFPIFERMSRSDGVSPNGLLKLLSRYVIFLVQRHGPETGLKSWRHAAKILGICRTMLKHRRSSSLFAGLSQLLASMCLYFPDLEIRDNSRYYLRMLVCIPGKKLKRILSEGEDPSSISNHPSSVSNLRRSSLGGNMASLVHVERATPLLVKQSWSLSLPNLGTDYFRGIRDRESTTTEEEEEEEKDSDLDDAGSQAVAKETTLLRVMDARVSEMVRILRRHFSLIPDYRHMPGLKIGIRCSFRFDSELFVSGASPPAEEVDLADGLDKLPALYATVLTFTSAEPYGSIPSFRIPFLLGTPPRARAVDDPSAIVPAGGNGKSEYEKKNFTAPVFIELEPREPMPGLVNVCIDSNADDGKIIQGQLRSVSVGIEDMFLRAMIPDGVSGDAHGRYVYHLFNALWEACETSSGAGREAYLLKGGKGVAAVAGTRSVKLIETPFPFAVEAVERHLAPFVAGVIGEPLAGIVKSREAIRDTTDALAAIDDLKQIPEEHNKSSH